MKVPFCGNHGCFGSIWFHWQWTSLCTAKKCLDLAIHWYTEKRGKSVMFLLPRSCPLIFPRFSQANGYAPVPVLVVLKVILRVSGRVFKLSCSRALLRLHILVIPRSNLDANEDDTFIGNRGGGFVRVVIRVVLSFIWISRLGKTLKERWVFLFSWLTTFISHTRLLVQRAVRVSSLVIVWRESSPEANSKRRYRRSR